MKFIRFFKRPLGIFTLVIIGVVLFFGIRAIRSANGLKGEIITVERATLHQTVSISGKTAPVERIKLSFAGGGTLQSVLVKVGDRITKGALVAQLDVGELDAKLTQDEAAHNAARAKLNELSIESANAYTTALPIVHEAFIKGEEAVNQKTDDMFTNDTTNPQLSFTTLDTQARIDAVALRRRMTETLGAWRELTHSVAFSSRTSTIENALMVTKGYLLDTERFLQRVFDAVNFAADLSSSAKGSYQANITSARTSINAVFDKINSQEQTIALQQAKVASQEAEMRQIEAGIELTRAQMSDATLRSPIAGVITKTDKKPGEVVSANETVVGIISENDLEIETNVPEIDIAKISVGNPVRITLDALQDETFDGTVVHIDPAETVVDGAVNFKIDIAFNKADPRVKSGLTANLDIETAKKENVLAIPAFAIRQSPHGAIVKKIEGKTTVDAPVIVGLRGHGGMIEIVSGLDEGDRVLAAQ